jgi:hypothetical protein
MEHDYNYLQRWISHDVAPLYIPCWDNMNPEATGKHAVLERHEPPSHVKVVYSGKMFLWVSNSDLNCSEARICKRRFESGDSKCNNLNLLSVRIP